LLAALAASLSVGCFSTNLGDRLDKYMVFATGTKFGLDFTQNADQTVDIAMGYDRAEIASIPTALDGTATPEEDVYSVIGGFCVRYTTPWDKNNDFRLRQVFATGEAAVKTARDPKMREYFEEIMTGDTSRCDPKKEEDDQASGGGDS
jgi:hypothetical protein